MKNGWKLLAGVAAIAAATGAIAYKKYQNHYEMLPEHTESPDDSDFEPIVVMDDGFDYVVEDPDQIFFYE